MTDKPRYGPLIIERDNEWGDYWIKEVLPGGYKHIVCHAFTLWGARRKKQRREKWVGPRYERID